MLIETKYKDKEEQEIRNAIKQVAYEKEGDVTMPKEKIPKSFLSWFKKHFAVEKDLIDINAEYDKALTLEENKNIFMDKFSMYYAENQAEMKERIKALEQENKKADFEQRKSILEQRLGIKINFVR